jgi:hypothetical protein
MAPTLPCRFYALGKCNNGSKCTFSHQDGGNTICEFYLQGSCQFGNYCKFRHEKPKSKQSVKLKPVVPSKPVQIKSEIKSVSKFQSLCPFHITGNCHNPQCQYTHGITCPICKKNCLDPNNPKSREEHKFKCKEEMRQHEALKGRECVVCFEVVYKKVDPRFGLLDCDHCVCLECIRTWREAERVDTAKVSLFLFRRVLFVELSLMRLLHLSFGQRTDKKRNKL